MREGGSGRGGEEKLGRKEEAGLQTGVLPQQEQQPSSQQLELPASQEQ
jgi:hypothetical protein